MYRGGGGAYLHVITSLDPTYFSEGIQIYREAVFVEDLCMYMYWVFCAVSCLRYGPWIILWGGGGGRGKEADGVEKIHLLMKNRISNLDNCLMPFALSNHYCFSYVKRGTLSSSFPRMITWNLNFPCWNSELLLNVSLFVHQFPKVELYLKIKLWWSWGLSIYLREGILLEL